MSKHSEAEYPPIADPIIGLFCNRWQWAEWQIILAISTASALIFFGAGIPASISYTGPGQTITSVDNISFIVAWLVIFLPLLWSIYLWQPRATKRLYEKLQKKGVFGTAHTKVHETVDQIFGQLGKGWVYLFVVVLIIGFWIYEIKIGWPNQFRLGAQYWWEVGWYMPLHVAAWSVGLYALFTLVIRQLIIVYGLREILKKTEITIEIFDPDGAGGLGSIGEYVKSSILFIVGIGLIAALFAIEVYLTGAKIIERGDVMGLFAVYVFLAPICLYVPITSTQNALLRAQQKDLEPVARKFQQTLDEAETQMDKISNEKLKELNDRLEQLKKHRDLIMQNYPTSPLTFGAMRNFSLTALLPIVSGIASIILQLIK